jgi:alpha-1,3-glucan synthase
MQATGSGMGWIKQDPNADLFVFVGRWSKQKGVDLIADVISAL